MSKKVINGFTNLFNKNLLEVIKKQNLKQIPLPIYPVNTDNEIMNYHSYLSKYIEYNIHNNHKKYVLKPIPNEFPIEYFNYEST